jgi:hypothetical protein
VSNVRPPWHILGSICSYHKSVGRLMYYFINVVTPVLPGVQRQLLRMVSQRPFYPDPSFVLYRIICISARWSLTQATIRRQTFNSIHQHMHSPVPRRRPTCKSRSQLHVAAHGYIAYPRPLPFQHRNVRSSCIRCTGLHLQNVYWQHCIT